MNEERRTSIPKVALICVLLLTVGVVQMGTAVARTAEGELLVFQGAKVYTSPTASPITNGIVVVRNGRIDAVVATACRFLAGHG